MIKQKMRESNIELLRIFSIIMIIIHHLFIHSINHQVLNNYSSLFGSNVLYKRLLLTDIGAMIGKTGNDIFILISGYFLCERKNVNINKQIKKLTSQLLYASILTMIASTIISTFIIKNQVTMQPFEIINSEWWFVGYYLLIITCGSVFLNKFIASIDKKKYTSLVLILFAVISLPFPRELISGISSSLFTLVVGIFFYCLGGYIKKYNKFDNYKLLTLFMILLSIIGLHIFSYRNFVYNSFNATFNNSISSMTMGSTRIYNEYSIIPLSLSICIFELFRRIKIKKSIIINYIAKSTLMIYLIHETPFLKQIYQIPNWAYYYKNNLFAFILMIITMTFLIFSIGVIAYAIYNRIVFILNKNKIKKLFLKKI